MKLSELLSTIDRFYKQAHTQSWTMPDDEEEPTEESINEPANESSDRDKLSLLAEEIRKSKRGNQDLADELDILGIVYDKALRLGKGFNYVKKSIDNIFDLYLGEDEGESPEQTDAENLLNAILVDLRKFAGGGKALNNPDDPKVIEQLKAAQFEYQQTQAEETGISQYMDESEQDLEDEQAEGIRGDKLIRDETRGEKGDKSTGGIQYGRLYEIKDKSKIYQAEKARYLDLLNQTQSEDNPKLHARLSRLIETLNELSLNWKDAEKLKAEISSFQVPDEAKNAQLKSLIDKQSKLLAERADLKTKIKQTDLDQKIQNKTEELRRTRDSGEQFKLEQEKALLELARSTDINKKPERKARLALLNAATKKVVNDFTGEVEIQFNKPGGETLRKMQERIEAAKALRKPIEVKMKEDAAVLKGRKKTIDVINPNTGKIDKKTDWANVDLKGFNDHFKQSIATERGEVKRIVKARIEKLIAVDNQKIYTRLIEGIAEASKDGNILNAVKALRNQLKQDMIMEPSFIDFTSSVRAGKFFRKYLEKLKFITKNNFDTKKLDQNEIRLLKDIIEEGNKLYDFYSQKGSFKPGDASRRAFYSRNQVRILVELLPYLNGILERNEQ